MTDRRDEERGGRRALEEDEERRLKERERRSDQLREAWRRNHPGEPQEGDGKRPGKREA